MHAALERGTRVTSGKTPAPRYILVGCAAASNAAICGAAQLEEINGDDGASRS
jgi:hypothetical protein